MGLAARGARQVDGSGVIPIDDEPLQAELRRKGRRILLESAAVAAVLATAAAFVTA
jgi:hypothetical protein